MKLDRVFVPLDGSPLAEGALPIALGLLSTHPGSTLILMRATQATLLRPWVDPIEVQTQAVSEAVWYLQSVADRVRDDDPGRTVATSVWYGPPARSIVDAANARGAQLIVMSTHGRSGLPRMVLGSVAESVVRATTTPTLLVPAHGGPASRPSGSIVAHRKEAAGV